MTEPEDMKPEELVRFLAVEGMGRTGGIESAPDSPGHEKMFWFVYFDDEANIDECWNPLSDANDRDMLVERMRELGWEIAIAWGVGNEPRFAFAKRGPVYEKCYDEDASYAFCIAAAKAIQAKDGG